MTKGNEEAQKPFELLKRRGWKCGRTYSLLFLLVFFGKSYLSLQVLGKGTAVSLDWSGGAPWASIEQS